MPARPSSQGRLKKKRGKTLGSEEVIVMGSGLSGYAAGVEGWTFGLSFVFFLGGWGGVSTVTKRDDIFRALFGRKI